MQSLSLSHAYFMYLNEDIVEIEKPDGVFIIYGILLL